MVQGAARLDWQPVKASQGGENSDLVPGCRLRLRAHTSSFGARIDLARGWRGRCARGKHVRPASNPAVTPSDPAPEAAVAAAPPANEAKPSPSELGAATGRRVRPASANATGLWSKPCPACRASYRACARTRATRTLSRRDAAPRTSISLAGPRRLVLIQRGVRRAPIYTYIYRDR